MDCIEPLVGFVFVYMSVLIHGIASVRNVFSRVYHVGRAFRFILSGGRRTVPRNIPFCVRAMDMLGYISKIAG